MPIDCAACGQSNPESAACCSGCGRSLLPYRPAVPLSETSVLVGRQHELGILLARLDDASAGRGGIAMLAGEAGIGKTWIAREVARQAAGRGVVVLWGSCLEGDWQPPYGPWVEAVGDYVRSSEVDGLGRALGPGAAALAQIVPEVRAILPDTPPAPPLSPSEERLRLYEAMTQFLLSIASQNPILLVLDDLHWADRDSLGLLRSLVHFIPRSRLLVVGAYRDVEAELARGHPLTELLAGLHREDAYQNLLVRGLGQEEVAEYLTHWAGQALPAGLVEEIYAQTDGNPFYVREVFRHLLEERKILQRSGRWSTDLSLGELGIPDGVRRVVERRVACLSEETARMLRLAAAFRSTFAFASLQALMDLPEEPLLACLDEALAAGLLTVAEGEPPRYDFAHTIVRQSLYDRLNPDRRARLHRRIAEALLRVCAGQESRHAAEIAAQYHASRSLPGAADGVPYALAAAEQASAGYAHERTVTFLRMARDLSAKSEDTLRAKILCDLAIAEAQAVMPGESRRSVEAALTALAASGADTRARAEFLMTVSRTLKDGGVEPAIWEPLVEQGLALAGEKRDLLWARLVLLRDHFEPVSQGPPVALRWLGQDPEAVAVARTLGDEDDYARTLSPLAWRTREETDEVLALVRTWRHPNAVMRGLGVVTSDLVEHHFAWREAVELLEELHQTSLRCGSLPGQAEAVYQLGATKLLLGEMADGQKILQQAHELIASLGSMHRLQLLESAPFGFLAYYLDIDWAVLAEMVSHPFTTMPPIRTHYGLASSAFWALIQGRLGNVEEARRLLTELTPVAVRMDPRMHVHNVVVTMGAGAVWDLRAVEFADAYERMAHDLIEAGVGAGPLSPNELAVARMAALRGDMALARGYFARARGLLDARAMHHLRPVVDYDEALALIRSGSADHPRILALLHAALMAFESLGMSGWAKRALDLMGKLAQPAAPTAERPHSNGLTPREVDVLRLLASGRTNREIAEDLVLSPRTVEQHIAHVYGKIGARGRADATAYALRHGLLQSDAE